MKFLTCLVGAAFLLLASTTSASNNNDLRVFLTNQGLDTLSDILLQTLRDEAFHEARKHVQNVEESEEKEVDLHLCRGTARYGIENGKLTSLEFGSARIWNSHPSISAETSLNAGFSGRLHWRLRCGRWIRIPQIRFSGGRIRMEFERKWVGTSIDDGTDFSVDISDVSFHVRAVPSTITHGLPMVAVNRCEADLDDTGISIDFSGGMSELYNVLSRNRDVKQIIKTVLQRHLTQEVCKVLQNEVRKVNTEFTKIPLSVPLPEDLGTLTWRFSPGGIMATSGHMEIKARGAIVPPGSTLDELLSSLPEQGPMDTSLVDPEHDIIVLLDGTLMNSALKAATLAGHLSRIIPSNQLPPELAPNSMPRAAAGLVCSNLPGDAPLSSAIRVNDPPLVGLYADGIHIQLRALVDVMRDDTQQVVMTLAADANVTAAFEVENNTLVFNATDLETELSLVRCISCQSVQQAGFAGFWNNLKKSLGVECATQIRNLLVTAKPKLNTEILDIVNELGNKGIRLPKLPGVEFRNPDIRYSNGTVALATDFWVHGEALTQLQREFS